MLWVFGRWNAFGRKRGAETRALPITLALAGLLACPLAAILPIPAVAAGHQDLADEAMKAYQEKDYVRSAELFAAAIEAGGNDSGLFYDAACSNALAGRAEAAFDVLDRAVAAGFGNVAHLRVDPDLTSLRSDPRWGAMIERIEARSRATERFWNSPAFTTPYRASLSEDERIAGLSRLWAEVKYNFANFDLVPGFDWDSAYVATLPRVRATGSTLEYYRLLIGLAAGLKDGHTGVGLPKELVSDAHAIPGLSAALIEDHVIVTRVMDEELRTQGIEPGVEILEVEGVPVRRYAAERVAPFVCASTPQDLWTRIYARDLFAGSVSRPVDLLLRSQTGDMFRRKVRRMTMEEQNKLLDPPPLEFRLLPQNVALVTLRSFVDTTTAAQFEAWFDEISKADALILDLRENGGGNSNVGFRVLASLVDKPFLSSRWRTRDYRPSFRAWGRSEGTYGDDGREYPPSGRRFFAKPVIVLTSAQTYSAAEDFAVAFDAAKRGTIVGEPTGGSTGQPVGFRLPGGGSAWVCTKRDTYPDGKEFVGVGVQPQVLVHPQLEDFRSGRDTVLEAALEALGRR